MLKNMKLTTAVRGTNNAALASVLGALDTAAATGAVSTAKAVMAYIKQVVTLLLNGTYGLSALKTAITAVPGTNSAFLATSGARILNTLDFWSLPQEEVALTGTAGDKSLPSVVVAGLPSGATVVRAIAMFKFWLVENHTYAGTNALEGATEIQVKENAAGSYIDAINFVDAQYGLEEGAKGGGDVSIGAIDVKAQVDANDTYAFHWDEAEAEETGINFKVVQTGLRIWYSL